MLSSSVDIPGGCGMTSPVYSELPQELLLDVDPMRPTTYKYDH